MQAVNSTFQSLIESRNQIPITRVTVYPTTKTVPSMGMKVAFYTLDDNDAVVSGGDDWFGTQGNGYTDLATGVNYAFPTTAADLDDTIEPESALAFDWGVGGSPSPVGKSHLYAIRWHGFFFVRYSGYYHFYGDSSPISRIRLKLDGAYLAWGISSTVIGSHTASFDATLKQIEASSGTPYANIDVGDVYEVTGNTVNAGSYTVASKWLGGKIIAVSESLTDETNATSIVMYKAQDNWLSSGLSDGTRKELFANTQFLEAGTFVPIQVEMWVPSIPTVIKEPSYMCIKYREPPGSSMYDMFGYTNEDISLNYQSDNGFKKVLSAGVVTCSMSDGTRTGVNENNAGFLTGNILTSVQSISGSHGHQRTSEYSVEIPVPNATTLRGGTSGGGNTVIVDSVDGFPSEGVLVINGKNFKYDRILRIQKTFQLRSGESFDIDNCSVGDTVALFGAGDYPFNPRTYAFGAVRHLYLCRIEAGNQDPNTGYDYYADRLWGLIYPNPRVMRNHNEDKLTFTVSDFSMLLLVDYFRNYPDFASYSAAGYYEQRMPGEPNGFTRPTAYDRWYIHEAIRDILIKAGVDPVWLYGRNRKKVTEGANFETDYGDYLIRGSSRLDSSLLYGRPDAAEGQNQDDAYHWFFGWGKYLAEGLAEIRQNYLYLSGFKPNGFAMFKPVNLPSQIFNDDGFEDTGVTVSNPVINLTAPDGGGEYIPGEDMALTWVGDSLGNVDLQLYYSVLDEALGEYIQYTLHPVYGTIVSGTPDDGSYTWTMPSALPCTDTNGNVIRWKIKIIDSSDSEVYDFSDSYFTFALEQHVIIQLYKSERAQNGKSGAWGWTDYMYDRTLMTGLPVSTMPNPITVSQPNGSESITRGAAYAIMWGSETYMWNVPANLAKNTGDNALMRYKIRISEQENLSNNDFSDNYFTVT